MPILSPETSLFPEGLLDRPEVGTQTDERWWALYSLPRHEKQLMRKLHALEASFYAPLVPKRSRSPQGRVRVSHVPLFSGYVFLYGDATRRHTALTTNCVSRCLEVSDGVELTNDLRRIRRMIEVGQPLTPEALASTVEGVAAALREGYVFPDKAEAMAQSILGKLKAGTYDTVTNEAALANRLTDDLRAITHDKHLGVRLAPRGAETAARPGGMLHNDADQARRENYAFRKAEVLPGNIGYVRFDAFLESEGAQEAAAASLAFLANCDALIFDLRNNGGGSPEMIRFITSYLFEEPTHLNDMVDRQGSVVSEYWTLKEIPGKRFASDLPVFVLTSKRTFSGAEEFSYNLKNLRRATIVGETTGGGAHPVRSERVNDRFIIGVPFMRAQNPISNGNVEIGPDYKTDPDLTDKGNLKGKSFEFSMRLADSKIFRGDDSTRRMPFCLLRLQFGHGC